MSQRLPKRDENSFSVHCRLLPTLQHPPPPGEFHTKPKLATWPLTLPPVNLGHVLKCTAKHDDRERVNYKVWIWLLHTSDYTQRIPHITWCTLNTSLRHIVHTVHYTLKKISLHGAHCTPHTRHKSTLHCAHWMLHTKQSSTLYCARLTLQTKH